MLSINNSTTINNNNKTTTNTRQTTNNKMNETNNRSKKTLIRSASIQKLIEFNTYICSQQFYLLPGLINWLKSSQTGVETAFKLTIIFFRSLVFNKLKMIYDGTAMRSRTCLTFTIYVTALALLLELFVCFYYLMVANLPIGLVFLIVCWGYIMLLQYQSISFFISNRRRGGCNSTSTSNNNARTWMRKTK